MDIRNQYFPSIVFHPGETLEEKLEEMGMSKKEFALRTGKPEKTIIAIIKGNSSVTKDMAFKFENVTKIPVRFWLNSQQAYDEFIAKEKREKAIEQACGWAKMFPYPAMANNAWLPKTRKIKEKAENLLSFFQIAEYNAWENIFLNKQLKVAFRISLAQAKEAPAISAWLQQGQNKAKEINAPEYNKVKFQENLKEIKKIMAKQPNDFFTQLQELCLQAGVVVLYTPNLPKAPIHGSTRWLNNTPLIQLSARYRQNDRFWFTFFHEAGHIILHGKKYISIENGDFEGDNPKYEKEADEFAVKWTLTKEQEEEVINALPVTELEIKDFAEQFGTHPAMIIGRLQHLGLIHFSIGRQFIESIDLSEK